MSTTTSSPRSSMFCEGESEALHHIGALALAGVDVDGDMALEALFALEANDAPTALKWTDDGALREDASANLLVLRAVACMLLGKYRDALAAMSRVAPDSTLYTTAQQRVSEIQDRIKRVESTMRKAYAMHDDGEPYMCIHQCVKVTQASAEEPGAFTLQCLSMIATGQVDEASALAMERMPEADSRQEHDVLAAVVAFTGRPCSPSERLSYSYRMQQAVASTERICDGFFFTDSETECFHRHPISIDLMVAALEYRRAPSTVIIVDATRDWRLADWRDAASAITLRSRAETAVLQLARFVVEKTSDERPGDKMFVRRRYLSEVVQNSPQYRAVLLKYLADQTALPVTLVTNGFHTWCEMSGTKSILVCLDSSAPDFFKETSTRACAHRLKYTMPPATSSTTPALDRDSFTNIRVRLPRRNRDGRVLPYLILKSGTRALQRRVVSRSTRVRLHSCSSDHHQMLVRHRHPNLIQYSEVSYTPDGGWLYYCEHRSNLVPLLTLLHNARYRLPLCTALRVALSAATGLQALHDSGVIHANLQPNTIMCQWDVISSDISLVKLSEFGVCNGILLTSDISPLFVPPNFTHPNKCHDIFALGCLLAVMLAGRPPPPNAHSPDIFTAALVDYDSPYCLPKWLPSDVAFLIADCLDPSDDARPKAVQCARRLRQIVSNMWCGREVTGAGELFHTCDRGERDK